jgi:hypothetical protein
MRQLIIFSVLMWTALSAAQSSFDQWFEDKTLRVDYYHTGDSHEEQISLDALYEEGKWPGRVSGLVDSLNVGQYLAQVYDAESGKLIYSCSYSSVFGEWQTTTEAASTRRTMQETVRIPYPHKPVKFELLKRDRSNRFLVLWTLDIDPSSRFINREKKQFNFAPKKFIDNGGASKDKVDLVILGDGYTTEDLPKFRDDVAHYTEVLLGSAPFKDQKNDFNIWTVECISSDRGIDEPRKNHWAHTALGAQYNAFDLERYVLTFDNKSVRDIASLVPYDVIYILINSPRYGGGGIYNQFAICYTGAENDEPAWWSDYVFVHEFGHSFAALADEYYTSDVAYNDLYPLDVEPWEPNITTLQVNGKSKWQASLSLGIAVPTPWNKTVYDSLAGLVRAAGNKSENSKKLLKQMEAILKNPDLEDKIGCFEGAGYASQGIYRPALNCRMFSKSLVDFCPACRQAISRMIDFTVGKPSRIE